MIILFGFPVLLLTSFVLLDKHLKGKLDNRLFSVEVCGSPFPVPHLCALYLADFLWHKLCVVLLYLMLWFCYGFGAAGLLP